jgi:hypothetical protein
MNRIAKLVVAMLVVAIAVPAGATSVTGVKVTRLRRGTTNDVFVQVTVPPATLDCVGGLVANEVYVFDGETANGRILDALLLSAYSANKTVDIVGTGTCRTFGISPFNTRFELIDPATIR